MTGTTADALRDQWDERHRYPSLLVALHDEGRPRDLTVALLADLLRPHTTAETFEHLVTAGELELAAYVLEAGRVDGAIPASEAEVGRATLQERRAAVVAGLRRRLEVLDARSERARIRLEGHGDVLALAEVSERRATDRLAALTSVVVDAEATAADGLRAAMDEAGWLPDDDRRAVVEACIKATEFSAALHLLDGAELESTAELPASVARPKPWPLDEPVEQIAEWRNGPALANAATRNRLPAADDRAANDLLTALGACAGADGRDRRALGALLDALDASLGLDGLRHTAEWHDGLLVGWIYGLDDPRLPRLGIGGRDGQRIVVVPRSTALPDRPDWLRDDDVVLALGPLVLPGCGVVKPDHLLELLSVPRSRRPIHILREVGRQVPMSTLLQPGPLYCAGVPRAARRAISWLLDLLGVEAEPGVVDVVLHDVGSQPWLAEACVDQPVADPPHRAARLTMTDVDEGRRAPVWLTTVASTLSDRMRDRLEALAVLYTVVHLSGGGEAPTSRADVTEHMARLGANFYLGSLAEVYLGVDDAIDWLAQEGFLSGSHERTVAIPAGLGRMLASAAPGGAVEASEAALYRCIHRRYRQDLGEHAVVVDLSARMSAHAVKNQAEKLNAALGPLFAAIRGDRINPETAALVSLADTSEAIEELKDTVDAIDRYQSQAAEETTVDLAPMLETVVRKAEVEYPNTSEDGRAVLVSYRLDIDPAALPSIVVAEHLLRYSLNDLLENACHATRAVGGGEVVLRAGTDAIHHPDGDRPAVRFEIEDPGEGLPAELGPLLGARRFTMKPNGTGVGLALVQRMAERYGGYLREVPSPDQSGTCMRLVLPVEPITPDALGIGKPR